MVDSLAEKMISFALPDSYKYLLWSAKSGKSLFDSVYEKKRTKKNQKYLIHEQKQKTQQELNDIWSVIAPDEKKKAFLVSIQPIVIEFKKQVQDKVKEFIEAKNRLMLEISKLRYYLDSEVINNFSVRDMAKVLLWIESKKHEKELSATQVFEIKDLNEMRIMD